MRVIVLMVAVAVQIAAGFSLMHILDDFIDGGKLNYYRWVEDEKTKKPNDDSHPSKSEIQVTDQNIIKKSKTNP